MQETASGVRSSDVSSAVSSSDLVRRVSAAERGGDLRGRQGLRGRRDARHGRPDDGGPDPVQGASGHDRIVARGRPEPGRGGPDGDRKGVVEGKSVSVRVEHGGGRRKKTKTIMATET